MNPACKAICKIRLEEIKASVGVQKMKSQDEPSTIDRALFYPELRGTPPLYLLPIDIEHQLQCVKGPASNANASEASLCVWY